MKLADFEVLSFDCYGTLTGRRRNRTAPAASDVRYDFRFTSLGALAEAHRVA